MDSIYVVKETTLTTEKELIGLVLPNLGPISLQTRTKLKNSLKGSLIVVSYFHYFKTRPHYLTTYFLKTLLPSGVVYKFQYGLCYGFYYGQCMI